MSVACAGDGSDEAMDAEWLRREALVGEATEFVYLDTEPGLTRQRNIGAKRASGDVVLYMDDDMELDPDYVGAMLDAFGRRPEHGGGMGRLIETRAPRHGAVDVFRRLFMLTRPSSHGRLQPSGLPTHVHGESVERDVEILSGGTMAFRRWVFSKIEFDERLTGYGYMEDVDFSYRASRLARLFYEPRAEAVHHSTPESPATAAARRRMYAINHHYLFFKNIFATCKWCLLAYLWSVAGMVLLSALAGRWQGVLGYLRGMRDIARARILGRSALAG